MGPPIEHKNHSDTIDVTENRCYDCGPEEPAGATKYDQLRRGKEEQATRYPRTMRVKCSHSPEFEPASG